ncbi:hypothetical protein ACQP2P_11505 [Dactylosporangium sp. CA-139114]|uniref:hypothetical protein n=1 Tax=Dactylosporangium sp. CA-139114 TaxID=3239931 RepID=UPI003D99660A
MELSLVELRRLAGERLWFPFTYDEAGRGFNRQWWYNDPVRVGSTSVFLRALENDDEVARVELDQKVKIDHYAEVPSLGSNALAIQFIEVHNNHRLRGIGRGVIDLLRNRYPDRRLVAFSEGADGFWSSLGWRRHLHKDPETAWRARPLFIQSST